MRRKKLVKGSIMRTKLTYLSEFFTWIVSTKSWSLIVLTIRNTSNCCTYYVNYVERKYSLLSFLVPFFVPFFSFFFGTI